MSQKSNFVQSVLNDLHKTAHYLTEEYIFNEDGDPAMAQQNDMYGDQMQQQPSVKDSMHGENAEEQSMHAHEVIQHEPIIQKIREISIDGLKKYAEDPTSDIYLFFKKVFLDSDKVLTGDGNKGN